VAVVFGREQQGSGSPPPLGGWRRGGGVVDAAACRKAVATEGLLCGDGSLGCRGECRKAGSRWCGKDQGAYSSSRRGAGARALPPPPPVGGRVGRHWRELERWSTGASGRGGSRARGIARARRDIARRLPPLLVFSPCIRGRGAGKIRDTEVGTGGGAPRRPAGDAVEVLAREGYCGRMGTAHSTKPRVFVSACSVGLASIRVVVC
jgi:hypothetical protein